MSSIVEVIGRIQLAKSELQDLMELVIVNENPNSWPLYSLLEPISGTRIRYRLENLLIHLWSAKDYYKSEVLKTMGVVAAKYFVDELHMKRPAQLVQYLANLIKHGEVTRLPNNPFVVQGATLGTPYLRLWNEAYPRRLKPFVEFRGDEVPPFQVLGPYVQAGDHVSLGFDSIRVSAEVVDSKGSVIADCYLTCMEFSDVLKQVYSQAMAT